MRHSLIDPPIWTEYIPARDLVLGYVNTMQRPYGSVAFDASGFIVPNIGITKLTLSLRSIYNYPTSGYMYITFFKYDTFVAAQSQSPTVAASIIQSVSFSGGATITMPADIAINKITAYGQYFGVQCYYVPDSAYQTETLLVYPSLVLSYDTYTAYAPTNLTPSTGTFNPGAAIPVSWKYNSSGSPNDYQTGSVLQYSINNAAWVSVILNNRNNTHSFPANTFPQGASVRLRVQTISNIGTSDWSSISTITMYGTRVPDTLSPDNVNRNPASVITCTWRYVSSEAADDRQTGSILRYNVNNGAWTNVTLNNILNSYSFPVGRFANTDIVRWQVQAVSNVGTSGWSAVAMFTMAITPPLAPILIYPLNISVTGANGVMLEWQYNSPYDINPKQFDIRYRIDSETWIEKSNIRDEAGNRPPSSIMTVPIDTQSRVEWQVLAYGEFGDVGTWSDIGVFFTIGAPKPPTIVKVTNSNRPVVHFSALNIMSWELEITSGSNVVYRTGSMPFTGDFSHRMTEFLINGTYVVRMRIYNEFGLASEWTELAFTINTFAPGALKLRIETNSAYSLNLHFDNEDEVVYIYRSELEKDDYLRIARTEHRIYRDFSVRPRQRYKYFVRAVSKDDSFADSNVVSGSVNFLETVISEIDMSGNTLVLLHNIDGKPQKDISFGMEKTLTQFFGRNRPVLQIGEQTSKSTALSFYCTIADYEKLEILSQSPKILLLRDWRIGAIYGTIDGTIQATRETNGCIVSFAFTRVYFNNEVALE